MLKFWLQVKIILLKISLYMVANRQEVVIIQFPTIANVITSNDTYCAPIVKILQVSGAGTEIAVPLRMYGKYGQTK